MSDSQATVVGAVVKLTSDSEGNYKATQTDTGLSLPPGDAPGRISIDWSFGPIKISGYVDTDTLGVGLSISVLGISLGNIYGNLKDGVGVDVDLLLAKGSIKVYLKNGNEVWVHLDVKVVFDGSFDGDYKIVSI